MAHPKRYYWSKRIARLDPETEYEEITRILGSHEFPWDLNRALGYALFRTYAVPSIGELLGNTREFAERPQKRYDDTVLILGTIGENGFASVPARSAIRRMNQMHGSYDISNDDMRYVLSTFVVTPVHWMRDFAWRPLTPAEVRASTNYYRALGRHMAIKDIPETYEAFETLMQEYEAEHFGYSVGGRAVGDATMKLLSSFYPKPVRPALDVFSRSLMDEPLRRALRYPAPSPRSVAITRFALRTRGRLLRFFPPRMSPLLVKDLRDVRSYPGGFSINELGTFPAGCPVPHDAPGEATARQE
ncbi:hypothetical protein SAMN05444157_3227 [Frankineae bacterium MT45]|nr:hypothetical protein SAMN05444157_3227 [Frankineae bacterium MT45]